MIRIELPPNFDRILSAFPDAGKKGVLFAYDDDIFNPSGTHIPHWLLAHESQHCERQKDPEAWWERYITDDEFRYNEELIAHVEEYRAQARTMNDSNARARLIISTASRLVAPLYNYQPRRSLNQAIKDIRSLARQKESLK
jgi:hypothetical protein